MRAAAIGYVRASTTEQETTLQAQAEALRAYCTLRGLELVELIEDAGVSGSVPLAQRPAGCRVAPALKLHKAKHVVGLKLDRLFRDAADALAQTRAWDKTGIALHLCDMGGGSVDTSSPMGRMMLTMLAGFAEFERSLIAERTRSAMQHMRGRGLRIGAIPFGSRLAADGRHLERHEGEQAVIGQAVELRASGLTLRAVAAALTERGHLSRAGRAFQSAQVMRMVAA